VQPVGANVDELLAIIQHGVVSDKAVFVAEQFLVHAFLDGLLREGRVVDGQAAKPAVKVLRG